MKKIYCVNRTSGGGYDTYDSFVCCAENEEQAKRIHPSGEEKLYANEKGEFSHSMLASRVWNIKDLDITCIGEGNDEVDLGEVIVASFNAG